MKLQPYHHDNTRETSKVSMHNNSHNIAKFQPKIRVIHLFAPEIIKTDIANFRDLVQRLTGKPINRKDNTKKLPIIIQPKDSRTICPRPIKIVDTQKMVHKVQNGEKVKKENKEIWGWERGEKSNGLLGEFGDMDYLIQNQLNSEFPFLPMKSSSHMNMFGDMSI